MTLLTLLIFSVIISALGVTLWQLLGPWVKG